MIKFILVEDDKNTQDNIKKIINNMMSKKDIKFDISVHNTRTKILEKIMEEEICRKIYILDIELKNNKSGIDIAKEIRETDWDSEIIFITNHDKMFESAYRSVYKVFDFIEKFHNLEERLVEDLLEIIDTKYDTGIFKYHGCNLDLFIHYKEIIYLYRDKSTRKIVLVTKNNKFSVNLGVQEILDTLDKRFKLVHRACIVNMDEIVEFNWNENYFRTSTNEKVYMLSKRYKKEIGAL